VGARKRRAKNKPCEWIDS